MGGLLDPFEARCQREDWTVVRFLDGRGVAHELSAHELRRRAKALANELRSHALFEQRVLLLAPPGLEYIVAFFACLYAGALAVPAYPPDLNRMHSTLPRLFALTRDAAIGGVLTVSAVAALKDRLPKDSRLFEHPWFVVDGERPAADDLEPNFSEIAFLQYTSGSTGSPKGVQVTHNSLEANIRRMAEVFNWGPSSVAVSWLPPYHDMGLITSIIAPVALAYSTVQMSPVTFIKDPGRWVKAISAYKGTFSIAPNFAFGLTTRKTPPALRDQLDLSTVSSLVCGAEPIRAATLEEFADYFGPAGLDRAVIQPAYGLAENTLMASAARSRSGFKAVEVSTADLERGKAVVVDAPSEASRTLVSCGDFIQPHEIVDPTEFVALGDGAVGELWLAGDDVASGYFRQPDLSEATFGARLLGDERRWLRTGDLAFKLDGQLFIQGRIKDLIITAGRNYYPQDIELAAEESHPLVRPSCVAAFAVERSDGEALGLTAELSAPSEELSDRQLAEVAAAIRAAVWRDIGLTISELALLPRGAAHKTSSGKIQRRACGRSLANESLETLYHWKEPEGASGPIAISSLDPEQRQGAVVEYLADRLAELVGCSRHEIDPGASPISMGMTSLMAIRLVERMAADLELELPVTALLEGADLDALANAALAQTAGHPERAKLVANPMQRHLIFDLLDLQHAYWFGRRADIELGGIPTEVYYELDSEQLDLERFELAIRACINRHDALRTVVMPSGQQRILKRAPAYKLEINDVSDLEPDQRERRLEAIRGRLHRSQRKPMMWPLFDFAATKLGGGGVRLHLRFDSLIIDGSSVPVLLSDLAAYYADPSAELPTVELSFRDVVIAEKEWEKTPAFEARLRDALPDKTPLAPALPFAVAPADLDGAQFEHQTTRLDRETWSRIKARATGLGVTPVGLLLYAYSEVLAAWAKAPDFSVIVFASNRPTGHRDADKLVGPFSSTVLVEFADAPTPSDRAVETQKRLAAALADRDVGAIRITRELARSDARALRPIPVVFTSLLETSIADSAGALGVTTAYTDERAAGTWIVHRVEQEAGSLMVHWDYAAELFAPDVMDRMMAAHKRLLEAIARRGLAALDSLEESFLSPEERQARAALVATDGHPVPQRLLHQPFLDRVREAPGAPAVITDDRELTYGELEQRALAVAAELRARGLPPGGHVAVVMEKSWEQVVAVLAIEMAGGVYVPIDSRSPSNRLRQLVEASESRWIVTRPADRPAVADAGVDAVVVVVGAETAPAAPLDAPRRQPSDSAYVIYTSGSTGSPKGVVISHAGALNTIDDINRRFDIGPTDRVFGISSLSFDLSVYDVFGALAAGAAVVIPEASDLPDPQGWLDALERHVVTVWSSVPALAGILADTAEAADRALPRSLRLVMMSGDWIPLGLPERLRRHLPDADLVSLGGATEGSIWSVIYPIEKVESWWRSIPYGRPMSNQQLYVLDNHLEIRPDLVPGEIYIGGAGVALGYWNNPEQTRRHFISHPRTGDRLYRTGDLGRYMRDGLIEFLGREDHQVKIRGFRVELAEVETALEQIDEVREAVCLARSASGEITRPELQLVAFVVPRAPGATSPAMLRAKLGERLPDYMIPSRFAELDALPLTANGKVDRTALPVLDIESGRRPLDVLEAKIAALFAEVLSLDSVGRNDNFFEMGGDSVSALKLSALLMSNGTRLNMQRFVQNATVADVARAAASAGPMAASSVAARAEPTMVERAAIEEALSDPDVVAAFPLAPMQSEMRRHMQRNPDFYVTQVVIRLGGELDQDRLFQAWSAAVARHPALRAVFDLESPVQAVRRARELEWQVADVAGADDPAAELASFLEADTRRGLDLAAPIRCAVLALGPTDHALVMTASHLLLDGWSSSLIVDEVGRAYDGESFDAPPGATFEDFVGWLRSRSSGEDELYWRKALRSIDPPATRSQAPRERVHLREHVAGDTVRRALQRLASFGATPSSLVRAAWLLANAGPDERGCIGVATAGRPAEFAGVETLVGMLATVAPLPSSWSLDEPLEDWLGRFQLEQLETEKHAICGPAAICKWGGLERDPFDSCVRYHESRLAATGRFSSTLSVARIDVREQWHYRRNLWVWYANDLELELEIAADCDRGLERARLRATAALLEGFTDSSALTVGELLERHGC